MGDSTADILVDGSILEGGGQILRIATALAIIMKKSLYINRIRAGRPKPGLSHQHLAGINLCADLCGAKLSECSLGSQEVYFFPHNIRCGHFTVDAKTAGSVSLLLQVALPVLAFSPSDSTIQLRGGTDAKFAPPIDYMCEITSHYFRKMGLYYSIDVTRRGFFPKGGGLAYARINSLKSPLLPINMCDPGSLLRVSGYTFVAGTYQLQVAEDMRKVVIEQCTKYLDCKAIIKAYRVHPSEALGSIATFMLIADTSNGCRLGVSGIVEARGTPYRQLIAEAAQRLASQLEMGACCDEQMQDQLILPIALAEGCSTIRTGPLTMHTKTAIYITELMLKVKFEVTEVDKGAVLITCQGAGVPPAH